MSYGVGALGNVTLSNLSTVGKKCVAKREPGSKRRTLNQNRDIAFVRIVRGDGTTRVRGIRNGQLNHYKAAYFHAEVDYMLSPEGKRLVVKAPHRRKA